MYHDFTKIILFDVDRYFILKGFKKNTIPHLLRHIRRKPTNNLIERDFDFKILFR